MDYEPEITFEWECSMCGAMNNEEVDSREPAPESYRCGYCGYTHDGSEFIADTDWLEEIIDTMPPESLYMNEWIPFEDE